MGWNVSNQDPSGSLDPVYTVGNQIREAYDDPTLEALALLDGFPEDLSAAEAHFETERGLACGDPWANRYNRPYQSALPSWMFSP